MSSQNEGEQPDSGADPLSQFDAFRARRADDRAQQETQSAYSFPPEYAARPAEGFPPEYAADPDAPGTGGISGPGAADPDRKPGPDALAGTVSAAGPGFAPRRGGGRLRSIAIFAGVVVLAGAVGFGAYAVVDSSGSGSGSTAAGSPATTQAPATPTAAATSGTGGADTGKGEGKHGKPLNVRVVIASVGPDSFTGTLVATGQQVTVRFDADTRFGTAAHPFSRGQLNAGETVLVRGRRSAAGTLTAEFVAGAAADPAGTNA